MRKIGIIILTLSVMNFVVAFTQCRIFTSILIFVAIICIFINKINIKVLQPIVSLILLLVSCYIFIIVHNVLVKTSAAIAIATILGTYCSKIISYRNSIENKWRFDKIVYDKCDYEVKSAATAIFIIFLIFWITVSIFNYSGFMICSGITLILWAILTIFFFKYYREITILKKEYEKKAEEEYEKNKIRNKVNEELQKAFDNFKNILIDNNITGSKTYYFDGRVFTNCDSAKFIKLKDKEDYILDMHHNYLNDNINRIREVVECLLERNPEDVTLNKIKRMYVERFNNSDKEIITARTGIIGEKRVEDALAIHKKFKLLNGLIVRDNNGNRVECDSVIVSPHGIFVVEIKNYSENGKYSINIDNTGRWFKVYGNEVESMKSPVEQNTRHIAVLNNILIENGYEPVVKGVIVIANDVIDIINDSQQVITRPSSLYDALDKMEYTNLSQGDIENIIILFNSIKEEEKAYPIVNLEAEIEVWNILRNNIDACYSIYANKVEELREL